MLSNLEFFKLSVMILPQLQQKFQTQPTEITTNNNSMCIKTLPFYLAILMSSTMILEEVSYGSVNRKI